MALRHVEVAVLEPEHAERSLDDGVGRAAGVGGIGVLMGPVTGASQRATHRWFKRVDFAQADDSAIGTLQPEHLGIRNGVRTFSGGSAGDDQVREVFWI